MSSKFRALFGAALLLIGSLRIWWHVNATSERVVAGCLGNDFVLKLGPESAGIAHCWGCYSAALGIALIVQAVLTGSRPARTQTGTQNRSRV